MTIAAGLRPAPRHFRSKNFSPPRSKANPASVMAYSPMAMAIRVARIELQPWAMLANGPPWMNAGVNSVVCTRLGRIASFRIAAIEPVTPISEAGTGSPWVE